MPRYDTNSPMLGYNATSFKKGTKRAIEAGRKGGRSKSPKKSWAARLRYLKQKGLSDENARVLYEMMTEKDSFAFETLMWLQSFKKECNGVRDKVNVARALNDVCKIIHGSTPDIQINQQNIKNEQFNIQINIQEPKEEKKKDAIKERTNK